MSKSSAKVVPESKEDTGSSNPAKTPTPPETALLENTGEKNANKETTGRENKETMVGESKKVAEDGETEEESEGDEEDSEEDDGDNEEGDSGKEDSDEDEVLHPKRVAPPVKRNPIVDRANKGWEDSDSDLNEEYEEEKELVQEMEEELDQDDSIEHLGKDYQNTPWVCPRIDVAHKVGNTKRFMEGKGVLSNVNVSDFGEMGSGMTAYLLLVRHLAITFLFMSIVVFPLIVTNAKGARIPKEFVDPAYLLSTTIANAGGSTNHKCFTGRHDEECVVDLSKNTMDFFGNELNSSQYTVLVSSVDVVYTVIFLISIVWFDIRVMNIARKAQKSHIQASDYAIQVKNLPPDIKQRELMKHFEKLYSLENETLKDHEAKISKVEDMAYTRKKAYARTWIAQVSLAYDNTDSLQHLIMTKKLEEEIMINRGLVKMYSSGSPRVNEAKRSKILKRLETLDARFREQEKYFLSKKDQASAAVVAFIVFNNARSQERCVADYKSSTLSITKNCMRKELLFRGSIPIQVERAPDPTDIIWENLGIKKKKKRVMFAVSSVLMLLLLTASLLCNVFSYNNFNELSNKMMNNDCPVIRANYYQTMLKEQNSTIFGVVKEDDIPKFTTNLDDWTSRCPDETLFIGVEPSDGHKTNPTGKCVNDASLKTRQCNGLCPCANKYKSLEESTSADSDEKCDKATNVCRHSPTEISFNCTSSAPYSKEGVRQCYCLAQFRETLNKVGVFEGTASFVSDQGGDCTDVVLFFSAAKVVIFGAVAVVSVFNVIIQVSAYTFVKLEKHGDVSLFTDSQVQKTFLGLFINTVFVILFANSKISDGSSPGNAGDGKFHGFEAGWYPKVGLSLSLTILVDCFAPHIAPLISYLILQPAKQHKARESIKKSRVGMCMRHPIATQAQLNTEFEGFEFELPVRLATVLNTLGTVLCYAGALPAMIPIACVSFFISYHLDKFFLLKLYKRPPRYQLGIMTTVMKVVPVLVCLHLVFSALVYTEKSVLTQVSFSEMTSILGTSSDDIESKTSTVKSGNRLGEGHVFPLWLIFAAVSSFSIITYAVETIIPHQVVLSLLQICSCCKRKQKDNHKPPFSELYSIPFPPSWSLEEAKDSITDLDRAVGFEMRFIDGKMTKVRTEKNPLNGKKTLLRTWEVIRNSTGAYSYDIRHNPTYGAHVEK
jgi:hypothetical protein